MKYRVQYRRAPGDAWAPAVSGTFNQTGRDNAFASTFDDRRKAERIADKVREEADMGQVQIVEVSNLEAAGLRAMGRATVQVRAVPSHPGREWCDHAVRLYVDAMGKRYVHEEDIRSAIGLGYSFVFAVHAIDVESGDDDQADDEGDFGALDVDALLEAWREDIEDPVPEDDAFSESQLLTIAKLIERLPKALASVSVLKRPK
jgi:hypothetical protein